MSYAIALPLYSMNSTISILPGYFVGRSNSKKVFLLITATTVNAKRPIYKMATFPESKECVL